MAIGPALIKIAAVHLIGTKVVSDNYQDFFYFSKHTITASFIKERTVSLLKLKKKNINSTHIL